MTSGGRPRQSVWATLRLIAISLAFVAGGLWMAGAFGPPPESTRYPPASVKVVGYAATVFFGGCALVIGLAAVKPRLFDRRLRSREVADRR